LLNCENATVVDAVLCEPFNNGRETGRLLHDLGAMLALLNAKMLQFPILDFGAGTCWVTETLAKMGHSVVAFDIHTDLENYINGRIAADSRIDSGLIKHATGDGHAMPFEDRTFGHLLCYDTLHHMHDYRAVFREFHRVLKPGGRAIFVEPGAKHSTSQNTLEFLKLMAHDPSWIERDVVLEEINQCAEAAGFAELTVVPLQHPSDFMTFKLRVWSKYRKGHAALRHAVSERLAATNYDQRVVFFCEKPASEHEKAPAPSKPSAVQWHVLTRMMNRLRRAAPLKP
jgi:SAM-dependent methyltransferase